MTKPWRKYLPGDFGSPHWYTPEAFAGLVFSHAGRPSLMPLGDFIGRFTGLTRSTTRAAVRRQAGVDDYQLADLRGDRDRIPALLAAMQSHAKAPTTNALGPLGKDHLLTRIAEFGYGMQHGRSWYKQAEATVDGVPWIAEVLVVENEGDTGQSLWLMNHSVLMHDPTRNWRLHGDELYSRSGISGMFTAAHLDGYTDISHVTVVHMICPAPTFTDRGKTSLAQPMRFANELGKKVWDATKTVHREWQQAQRDAARAARQRDRARKADEAQKPTQRQAVFDSIPAAYRKAGGEHLPVGCRSMYYQARPLFMPRVGEVIYGYFSQLVAEYDRDHPGELQNLYYEARGELVEPHTRRPVALGTREIKNYLPGRWTLPTRQDEPEGLTYCPGEHLYDKVMYVEKRGLRPVIEAARIAERYDMAIMWGEGNANVSTRELAERLQTDHGTTIFVLHDADHSGYNIAIALAEETERMPDHHIDVIDLGLTVNAAIENRLEPEQVTRKKALPDRLLERLDETERQWFVGTYAGGKSWRTHRVELNAFTSTALVAYVEERLDDELAALGQPNKIVPPQDVADALAVEERHNRIARWARRRLLEDLGIDRIVAELVAEFTPSTPTDWVDVITAAQDEDQAAYWPQTVAEKVEDDLVATEEARQVRLTQLLAEQIGAA